MGYEFLSIEHMPAISWITLNRPERLNAMNDRLLEEFSAALDELTGSGGPVIGIRGAGRAFCSGYDIAADSDEVGGAEHRDPTADRARLAANIEKFQKIWDHPKPVIAAVHGYCLAGATQLCVFTDLTILADDARIGLPSIPIGGGYITPLWTPLVGHKRAKQMSFVTGSQIDAETASSWGWANYVVPAAELIDHVEALAGEIAKIPPEILQIKKLAINRVAEGEPFRSIGPMGAELDSLLHSSAVVRSMAGAIVEHGLKEAIAMFDRGNWSRAAAD